MKMSVEVLLRLLLLHRQQWFAIMSTSIEAICPSQTNGNTEISTVATSTPIILINLIRVGGTIEANVSIGLSPR